MSTNPLKPLFIFLLIFLSVVGYGFEVLAGYFNSNVVINGIIVTVGIIGLIYILVANVRLQGVITLFKETSVATSRLIKENETGEDKDDFDDWENKFEGDEYTDIMEDKSYRLKWIMPDKDIEVLKAWSPSNLFTHDQAETALGAVRLRFAEVRNFSNYLAGILIILGLLGTFLGLLEAIKSMGLVFRGDSISFLVADRAETNSEDILKFFDAISEPLGGMVIAFSSSLFGLSGSLIVGLFAFISARSQSFFLFDLFDWFKDRTVQDDVKSLDSSLMTSLSSSSGLMGSLMRGGMKMPQGQSTRALGGVGLASLRGGSGGITGELQGDGQISGALNFDSLNNVLERLEAISREAVEKNGLLAKAALKLGENLALEQKRLADIAAYEQQATISLAALRQLGEQQINLLNQQIEATYNTTDKEEFRALAAHFHRSFQTLLSDIKMSNTAVHDKINRLMEVPVDLEDSNYLASVTNQELNTLSSDQDDNKDRT